MLIKLDSLLVQPGVSVENEEEDASDVEKEKNEFYSYNEKDYSYGATDTNGQVSTFYFSQRVFISTTS